VKTTLLFKAPGDRPNSLHTAPEGIWIAEQHLPSEGVRDRAILVDLNGRVLRTVTTGSWDTSGMGCGDGRIWMCANAPPYGVFETDLDSRPLGVRQIPLGSPESGGGSHGAFYRDGKLWIASGRLNAILRLDARSWTPEFLLPITVPRFHDIAWDDGAIWMVTGTSNTYGENKPGLIKLDAATGKVLATVQFGPQDPEPHGLTVHNGVLYACDAGVGKGFVKTTSPSAGWVYRIDFI
jgi:outer membrane protein assembly factor BamB